ncbi:flagellar basal body P-ring formation chaperone FlgA [Aquibium sp. ELW1220]|jgi:flagella basal body P-ring formation protein FlgA|uniref:flagellar basal body P-ring formation chaperone FlgA n=1 Tax=Aquibium sp. ELW1220 TaxID=2976766 RepID=UPI0025B280A0|nr:flagellar basal body P-ring formation chaperone FlgA [Aquibium sp. ELW1220]MDN2580770.1 flagellar basal body P-ring formation chaperone FlgA [Aquibium sp. ELW1220]
MSSPLRTMVKVATATLLVVALHGAAMATDTAVIPKRVIYPGETIDAGALSEVPVRNPARITTEIAYMAEDIDGKVAKRTLLPGRFIPLSSVREAYVVEAGSPVEVNFIQNGLQITTMAIPLQPGSIGDMIRVRNVDSGAVFSGIVMANGTLRVGN